MRIRIKVITYTLIFCLLAGIAALAPGVYGYLKIADAAGGFPVLYGTPSSIPFYCILTNTGECVGGEQELCASVPGVCVDFMEVDGPPAGGNALGVLIRNDQAAVIGLIPGGPFISGCSSPVSCHAMAAPGGAAYAIGRKIESARDQFKIIIAGIKDKVK